MYCLVRKHGLADDVANGEDVRHITAHLNIDVDETAIRDVDACLVQTKLLAVGCAPDRLQHEVIDLW